MKEQLARYQAEMVNIARDLGLEPDVSISDPTYYGDMIGEAIVNLQAEKNTASKQAAFSKETTGTRPTHAELDPKGHVVLERNGDDALVFLGSHAPTPYVIAHGYDDATGEWAAGSYFADVAQAKDEFDPEIIADMTLRWEREDFLEEMRNLGYDLDTKKALDIAIAETCSYFKDRMSEYGSEYVHQEVAYAIEDIRQQNAAPNLKTVSEQVKQSAQAIDARNRAMEGEAR